MNISGCRKIVSLISALLVIAISVSMFSIFFFVFNGFHTQINTYDFISTA